ncbi:MAG: Gfo/Idh/MocA family oxidoreductase [Methanomicrobiaceae archaeon]|nr:Gfo/Idh/MocA family oxidoreductase [Methanomicrobiaceae archaeon]
MNNLRVGIIGLGVGEQHVKAYSDHPNCIVAGICDFSEEKLAKIQCEFPDAYLTRNADELLLSPDIDVISIASFDNDHADQVTIALNSGKHVFCEKPLCQTLEQAYHIKDIWANQQSRLKLGSNLVLRGAPLYKWLKCRIEEGFFGDIYAFDGEYLYGRLNKITSGWRGQIDDYSVIMGGGIHMIDLMLWLTNQRPTSVFASGNKICTKNTEFRYNDYVSSIMSFESGMTGRITANFGCVHRHHHVIRIYGTKATFLYDDAGPRIHTTRDPSVSSEHLNLNPLPPSKGVLIPDFIASVLNNNGINNETQIIFDSISICSAHDKSLKTQKQEMINYI